MQPCGVLENRSAITATQGQPGRSAWQEGREGPGSIDGASAHYSCSNQTPEMGVHRNSGNLFLTVLQAGNPRSELEAWLGSGDDLLPVSKLQLFLCVHTGQGTEREEIL